MRRTTTSSRTRLLATPLAGALPAALLLAACTSVPLPPDNPVLPEPRVTPVPPPPVSSAEEEALRSLVAQQDRLYQVAGPLLVRNPELCRNNARNLLGFTAKNKYSYSSEFVNAAQKLFGMDEQLKVTGVLAQSGAAKAGLQRGDTLIAVENQPLPQGQNAERQAGALLGPLLAGRTSVRLTVRRNGAELPLTVPLTFACAFGIELGNTDNVNAYGDGYRILITRGMLNVARSDQELAYVMAKEMAHNALAHANRQRMSATIGGVIDNLVLIRPDMSAMAGTAGILPYPAELDAAADKLSMYMLARAGYNIDNAPAFWSRLASQYPASTLNAYTALHPSTPARISAMQDAIKDIKAKQANRRPLLP